MPLALRGYVALPPHAAGDFDHGDVHLNSGRVFVAHTANNTLEVIDSIKRLLPQISSQLPPAIHLIQGTDRALSIRAAFKDIKITMAATLFLVVFVIYLFLQNASATLIPALALPFSILGTFVVIVTAYPLVLPDKPVAPVNTQRARDLLTAAVAAVKG